jgi:hypothetical protein
MDIGTEASGLANLIAPVLKPLATGLEFFGVGVILIGVALATAGYVRDLLSSGQRDAYERYRANLGRGDIAWARNPDRGPISSPPSLLL